MAIFFTQNDNLSKMTAGPFVAWDYDTGSTTGLSSHLFIAIHIISPRPVYLGKIENNVCYFNLKGSNDTYATSIVNMESHSPIYNNFTGGIVGVVVYGKDNDYSNSGIYTFNPPPFINALCTLPMNNDRVLSIRDTAGNVTSGVVSIDAEDGVSVRSIGGNVLEVSFPFPTSSLSPLRAIRFKYKDNIAVVTNLGGGMVSVTYMGAPLEDVCASSKFLPDMQGNLPDSTSAYLNDGLTPVKTVGTSRTTTVPAAGCGGHLVFNVAPVAGGASRFRIHKVGDSVIKMELMG